MADFTGDNSMNNGIGGSPFGLTAMNLTFDQIPSVTKVPIKRMFYPPRKHLSPANFETCKKWKDTIKGSKGYRLRKKQGYKRIRKLRQLVSKGRVKCRNKRRIIRGIETIIKNYLNEKNYVFSLPRTIAVFSVSGIKSDPKLTFDIHCCPTIDEKFVIEFRRTRGDAFIMAEIFHELKALFLPDTQKVADDEDMVIDSTQEDLYEISAKGTPLNFGPFNFDDLIL